MHLGFIDPFELKTPAVHSSSSIFVCVCVGGRGALFVVSYSRISLHIEFSVGEHPTDHIDIARIRK